MYLSYMHLYILQRFIIFTENVENASLFLSGICLHKLSNTNVVIGLYKIERYYKDLGIAGYLPTGRESYDGLSLQSQKFFHSCGVLVMHRESYDGLSLQSQTFFHSCGVLVMHSKVSQIVDLFGLARHCGGGVSVLTNLSATDSDVFS